MASSGIIINDKTRAYFALIHDAEDFLFVDADGKAFRGGIPGGWTMLPYKDVDLAKVPTAVKAEIDKVPPKDIYGHQTGDKR